LRKDSSGESMHVQLLTTDTLHHRYFAERLHAAGYLDSIIIETNCYKPLFPTRHSFEERRDAYEHEILLAGADFQFADLAPTFELPCLNEPKAHETMVRIQADVVLVFGTGILSPEVAALPRVACLNLHGGNPEDYRGLDSHLWAIYHRDFNNLVTTLHYVSPQLDTGDVVFASSLLIPPLSELHQLRSINTRACVDLSLGAITLLNSGQSLPRRKQVRLGRYYSAMPTAIKEECFVKFARYTATL
jgi:methionyl-tRNA formyltransferase